MSKDLSKLTTTKVLGKSLVYSMLSKILPILFGLFSLPLIIEHIGVDRFGVVTIGWLIFGYFSIFDLGLSKAIIHSLSNDMLTNNSMLQKPIARTLIQTLFLIGLVFAFLIYQCADYLTFNIFNVPPELLYDTRDSLQLVALAVPFALASSGLRGILETHQRFDLSSITDILNAFGVYLGLAAVTLFTDNLVTILGYLVAVRVVVFLLLFMFTRAYLTKLFQLNEDSFSIVKQALNFGGWVGISNFINPIIGQLDRYLIASLLTMAAVTYYSAPLDIILKLNILPFSIAAVLFPAFSLSKFDAKSEKIYRGAVGLNLVITIPLVTAVLLFAYEGLSIWLNTEFANQSTLILQLLAIGAFFTSMAQIPFTFIQAIGEPKKTAVLQLIEAVVYMPSIYFLIKLFGLKGAAIGRLLRVSIDSIALVIITKRISKFSNLFNEYIIGLIVIMLSFYLSTLIDSILLKAVTFLIVNILFLIISWFYFLDNSVKQKIKIIIN